MALEIFKLIGSIMVDSSKAEESIAKTDNKAAKLGQSLASGIGTVAKWGAAIGTAAIGATTAVVGMATSAADTADNIDKMSQKIGISRNAYQELDFICSQSGTSVDNLQAGMKTLTSAMDGAASGSKSNIEKFAKLGISVTDVNGKLRSQEEVMFETMSALQGMENQTEKARLATELFGRSGTELMPLLNGEAGSIEEMKNKAHELGLVLGDDVIDSGVKLTDTIDQLKRSFGTIVTQLGGAVMPVVQKLAESVVDHMPQISSVISGLAPVLTGMMDKIIPPLTDLAEKLFPVLTSNIETMLPILADAGSGIFDALSEVVSSLMPMLSDSLQQLMPAFQNIISAILPVLSNLLSALLPPMTKIVEAILPVIVTLLNTLMPIFTSILNVLAPILELIMNMVAPIIELIAKAIAPLIEILGMLIEVGLKPVQLALGILSEVFLNVFNGIFESASEYIDSLLGIFGGLIDFITGVFTGNWEKAFEGLKKIVENIFNGIVAAVKLPINAMIGLLNGFINGINKIQVPDWVPGVGGKGINIPNIPMLYAGGNIEEAGRVLVGEKGPEFLDLPKGASVTPLDKTSAEIDYDKLGNVFREALAAVGLNVSLEVNANENALFDSVVAKNKEWKNRHGGNTAMA